LIDFVTIVSFRALFSLFQILVELCSFLAIPLPPTCAVVNPPKAIALKTSQEAQITPHSIPAAKEGTLMTGQSSSDVALTAPAVDVVPMRDTEYVGSGMDEIFLTLKIGHGFAPV